MKTVTFYSFKGGVGRTLALINVGHALARRGVKVMWLDLDLEAPGLGRTPEAGAGEVRRGFGVSDLILGWLEGVDRDLDDCVREVPSVGDGWIRLMPAGTRPAELASRTASLVQDPGSTEALVFARLKDEIETRFAPDLLLVDSRTGLADVAGVCTVELPDLVVAVCGINEQNVAGMKPTLGEIVGHPFRERPPLVFLALSPIPSRTWMDVPTRSTHDLFRSPGDFGDVGPVGSELWDRVRDRCRRAWMAMEPSLKKARMENQGLFPHLRTSDLLHVLEHDPEVPILGELLLDRPAPLAEQYQGLATSIGAALLGLPRPAPAHDGGPLQGGASHG